MGRKSKEELLAEVHSRAMVEFDQIQAAVRDEREQCLYDRRFYSISGAQWEGAIGEQFENKPRFELNKVHLAVIRIFNEYRNNRITVDFTPKDGAEDDKLADTCDGLYRADEKDSGAEEAYDNAFEEGAGGGFGAWRLCTDYEDNEDEDDTRQRIKIEPIFDADKSVFFDLDAKRQDKADAKRCYVLTGLTRDAYKEKYKDDPTSWPQLVQTYEFDWCTPDFVYVAEMYEVEEKEELLRVFQGIALSDSGEPAEVKHTESYLDEHPDELETLLATGFREVRQKRVKRKKVRKYIMSGAKVLKDCGYIAGNCIPIVPFYGKRWIVDGVERCMGHVRLAKDAQRLINMLMSWLAEIAGRFDVEKPILTPEQIANHAQMWAEDNIKKYPYLLVNPITDQSTGQTVGTNQIGYTRAPNIPPAMAALMQIAEQALQDLLGNQQAGEQMEPNLSGKAVELIQNRLDMQVYIYMSNMAKAIKRSGEVWLSMMRDVAIEDGRKMKTVSSDGQVGSIEIMRPVFDVETGEQTYENDLSRAKFDVLVDVGPSSSSKRSATVRALTSLLQMVADPQDQKVISSMIMMNMEGEGMSEVRDYFRRQLLRMGVVKPTEEEAKELARETANQQPDPQSEYLRAEAAKAVAQSEKARADTVLTMAKAEETKAKTAETMVGIDSEKQQQLLTAIQAVTEASQPDANVPPSP
jgi:hypothetical protein